MIVLLCVAAVVAVFFVFPAVYEFYNGSTGDNQAAMATAMLMLMISGLTLFLSRLLTSPADRNKRQVFIR